MPGGVGAKMAKDLGITSLNPQDTDCIIGILTCCKDKNGLGVGCVTIHFTQGRVFLKNVT